MRNFLKTALFFTIFFTVFTVVINAAYLFIITATDWDFRKRTEALKLKDPEFEVLVLGNSLPEYGIDTELLTSKGIKSYNLSLIGNSDQTSYIQLIEYLENYTIKPKTVIYCVAAYEDAFYNKGIHPIVEFTMKDHSYGFDDLPLFKFRWFGVEFIKKVVSKSHRKTYLSFGQIKSPRKVADHTDYKASQLYLRRIEESEWIGKMAQVCVENHMRLIIIEMPGMKVTQNNSPIGPNKILFQNEYPALLFNFNSVKFCTIFDPENDWCGLSHLNKIGAEKFTNQVYQYLITDIGKLN